MSSSVIEYEKAWPKKVTSARANVSWIASISITYYCSTLKNVLVAIWKIAVIALFKNFLLTRSNFAISAVAEIIKMKCFFTFT